MTLDNILAVIRDILVVGYLFVVRIGVPLIITVMLGAWLRRVLEEKQEPVIPQDAAVLQDQPEPAAATVSPQ